LPNFRDYLDPVQIIFLLAFVVWWLLGASWLLQRSLRKVPGRKDQELGPCILGMLLGGLAAGVVGGLAFQLVIRIGENPDYPSAYRIPAAIVAILLAAPTAILVLYASLQLPLRRLILVSWPAITSLVVSAVALGTPPLMMSLATRSNRTNAYMSIVHLQQIDKAIREYEQAFENIPPANLQMLTTEIKIKDKLQVLLKKANLECPFLPDVPMGYFYYPSPSQDSRKETNSRVLRACEWSHPHSDRYHAVLFANGEARPTPELDFQSLLGFPENAEFARQFRAADANRR
jgi:hypothetical protein